ncbi:hypothetical protein BC829DRAFT_406353 [Chytridium lagenaria]|nr:hypothetical protein BC829DRAFT_406353 [Chytridium lagenaria]
MIATTTARQLHMPSSSPPILLVLDLNGTLIDRLCTAEQKLLARQNHLCPLNPDFHLNKARVYLRPYLDAFFDDIFARFDVAVIPLVDRIFERHKKSLVFHWDRTKCDLVSTPESPYGSVKNLERIWKSKENAMKIIPTPRNHLYLPTYSASNPNINFDKDTTLLSVAAYLTRLLEEHKESPIKDIRDYLEEVPLFAHSREAGLPQSLAYDFVVNPAPELVGKRHRPTREVTEAAAANL